MVRPYRRYNKYSIGKLLGKCSNIYLSSPAYLPRKDGREYSTLESHKSISYQIATEWWDETDRYEDKIQTDWMIVQSEPSMFYSER